MTAMHCNAAVIAILFYASMVHGGIIDDTDRRAKALWLPVQNSNCPTTCTGVGLVPVTLVAGDLNRAACAAFPPKSDDDDFYAGTWRKLAAGNRCQAADDDDDARIRSFTSNYYCACVPRKPGSTGMDAAWQTTACAARYSADPTLCMINVNGQLYVGQRDDDDGVCAAVIPGQSRGRRQRSFFRLCVTNRFGYLAFDKYDD